MTKKIIHTEYLEDLEITFADCYQVPIDELIHHLQEAKKHQANYVYLFTNEYNDQAYIKPWVATFETDEGYAQRLAEEEKLAQENERRQQEREYAEFKKLEAEYLRLKERFV